MTRTFRASIVFNFDIDQLEEVFDRTFSDRDAEEYILETFIEDLHTFVKYDELSDIIMIEKVLDEVDNPDQLMLPF